MAITKPAVRSAWADTAVPTTDIVDPGNTFATAGWLSSTTPPARQYFNWILNFCSNGIRYLCRRGIPDYDAAETYAVGDVVIGDNNQVFRSLVASNINNTPSTSATQWGALLNYVTTASLGTSLAGYVTTTAMNTALAAYETTAALASTLAGYVTTAALNSALAAYETTAALTSTLAGYVTSTNLSNTLASYATTAALSNERSLAANGSNISGGTVAATHLPQIGLLTGITIAADPGTTPTGTHGQMFFYY